MAKRYTSSHHSSGLAPWFFFKQVDPESARVWNYRYPEERDWRLQGILPTGKTLQQCGIVDEQIVLLEVYISCTSYIIIICALFINAINLFKCF
jgi:hypothetical protein